MLRQMINFLTMITSMSAADAPLLMSTNEMLNIVLFTFITNTYVILDFVEGNLLKYWDKRDTARFKHISYLKNNSLVSNLVHQYVLVSESFERQWTR